jgi:Peptidase inhibitor family I36
MMKRIILLSTVIVGLAAAADAQIRWGRGPVPRSGVCFYEDSDFRGDYFCTSAGQRLSTIPRGMGDRISSIRVSGNTDVTVFRDSSFRGRSARFGGDVVDLKREGWNDTISSIVIGDARDWRDGRDRRDDRRDGGYSGYGGGYGANGGGYGANGGGYGGYGGGDRAYGAGPVWGRGPTPREGACFYEDSNYRGRYFCVSSGDSFASMPSGLNDRISSIRVFRGGVTLFRDDDFRGRSTRINRDVPNLGSSWGDRVSSLRVF